MRNHIALVVLLLCLPVCGCTQHYARSGYPKGFHPFLAQYSKTDGDLRIGFNGGRYLPRNIHFRRYATSGGLAIDPVQQPYWAKMETWMSARVYGAAQLREPATVSFEIWQYDRNWENDTFRQRIELQIMPPPEVFVMFNGRRVYSGPEPASRPATPPANAP